MFSGVALSKAAGGKGRMAGKLPLQSFLDNVYVETSLSREERKPLLLCVPILPVLHVKALSVMLVAAVFYSEQKSLCVDLVRAALSPQWCLWHEGAQVLAHCTPCIWPSAAASPSTNQAESLALWVCIYLSVRRIASLWTVFALLNLVPCVCNLLVTVLLPVGVRTASVIIALTDGELQDAQFYYAEQEVSHFYPHPTWFMSNLCTFTADSTDSTALHLMAVLGFFRPTEPEILELLFIVLEWKISMKLR